MNIQDPARISAAFTWSERLLNRADRAMSGTGVRSPLGRWLKRLFGESLRARLAEPAFRGEQTLNLDARGATHRGEGFEIALPWSAIALVEIDPVEIEGPRAALTLIPRQLGAAPFIAPLSAFAEPPHVLAERIDAWRAAAARRPRKRPALCANAAASAPLFAAVS